MSPIDDYAAWLVKNKPPPGTEWPKEFRLVSEVYMDMRAEESQAKARAEETKPGVVDATATGVIDTIKNLPGQAVGAVRDLGRSAIEAYRGPPHDVGFPDPGEMKDYSPRWAIPAPGSFPYNFETAAGFQTANTEQERRDIIKKQLPDVSLLPIERDGKDYTFATYEDPTNKKMASGYLNPPGFDVGDVAPFVSQAGAYAFGNRLVPPGASGFLGRTVKNVIGGTGADIGLQKASQQFGSKRETNYEDALLMGAMGAMVEPFAPMVKTVYRKIFTNHNYFNKSTGKLTKEGQRVARESGLDPEHMNRRYAEEWARLARDGGDLDVARRSADMAEFNIPATRGTLTGDPDLLAKEQSMRMGVFGSGAKEIMRDADDLQKVRLGDAQVDAQSRLTGRRSETPAAAAADIDSGLRTRLAEEKAKVKVEYDALDDMSPENFKFTDTSEITPYIRAALKEENVVIDNVLTPAATRIQAEIDTLYRRRPGGGRPITSDEAPSVPEYMDSAWASVFPGGKGRAGSGPAIDLAEIDQKRKIISELQGAAANPTDRRAASTLINSYDDYVDNLINRGLFSGDEAAVEQLLRARTARRKQGQLFEPQGKFDSGGKIVKKIIEEAETPEQAVNFIFGASRLGAKLQSAKAAERIAKIFGRESQEWGAMKEVAWMKLSKDKMGRALSPEKFLASLATLKNEGPTLLNQLFSIKERYLINKYARAMRAAVKNPEKNLEKAGILESAIRQTLRVYGARQKFTKGNVGYGTALGLLARSPVNLAGLTEAARKSAARTLTSPIPGVRSGTSLVPGTGQAIYGQERE